jgi:hypothetical protein
MASNTEEDNRYALEQMRNVLKADTRPSAELSFQALRLELPRANARERRWVLRRMVPPNPVPFKLSFADSVRHRVAAGREAGQVRPSVPT